MKIKDFFSTHKQKIIVTSSILISFVSGFSICALLFLSQHTEYLNNTPIKPYNQSELAKPNPNCLIKGKANSKGILTYHLPGQAFYQTIKNVKCFDSEESAQSAGYVKAQK